MIFDLCGQPRPAARLIDGCRTGSGLIREHW
jgi:hypothetical protein